jgi:hypothetical protein
MLAPSRLLKNYCATLIRACAVLAILMYSLCTLRFLCSGRTRLKAARDVFQQPASRRLWSRALWQTGPCEAHGEPELGADD